MYGYETPVTDASKPNKQLYQKWWATTCVPCTFFTVIKWVC